MKDSPQLLSIFCGARERPSAEERAAYLDQACSDDAVLRARVEGLLGAELGVGNFLRGTPAVLDATADDLISECPGTVIGPYKLLEQIGEGGFGVVFIAEQQQPIRRKVALKVLKPGMDTREVVARFEAERQALALMDHPNIAHVFDGGATAFGRPYFIMELVRGVPISDFCDQNSLSIRERLALFIDVCHAVQHAHQKAIIHRDIKPSNVMVTLNDDKALVKVIDFGIAKATGQQLTDKTLFTNFAQMIGTPLYMSPEQAQMGSQDVDTRSDVYSLGVLLYELLTGTTPFDKARLRTVGYDEIRRIIREEEPPKPSTRIRTIGQVSTTISMRRKSDAKRLCALFRGELDWIVMKALEKDRNRRYETASAFAADVQRYLRDEPVSACPPSAMYRLQKFIRGNKATLTVLASLLVAVSIIAGAIGWNLRDRDAQQSDINNEIGSALQQAELLHEQGKWPEALATLGRAEALAAQKQAAPRPLLLEHLDELQGRLDADRRDRLFAARIEKIRMEPDSGNLEKVYLIPEGDYNKMKAAFEACYGIRLGIAAPEEVAAFIQRRPQATQRQLIAALDCCLGCANETDTELKAWLAAALEATDADPWRNRVRSALAMRDGSALIQLAQNVKVAREEPSFLLLLASKISSDADPLRLALLRQIQRAYPSNSWVNDHLGYVLLASGQLDEAIRFLSVAFALRPQSPLVCRNLAIAYLRKGSPDEAILAANEAIRLKPDYEDAHFKLGKALYLKGRFDEAIKALNEAIRLRPTWEWAFHYDVELAATLAACNEARFRDTRRALEVAKKALELAPQDAATWNTLGVAEYRAGNWTAALAALAKATELRRGSSYNWFFLAMAHWRLGQKADARKYYHKAVQWMGESDPTNELLRRFRVEAEQLLDMPEK
jgi:serine/threonine protein kinase/Flp pilus assembly protein TadD